MSGGGTHSTVTQSSSPPMIAPESLPGYTSAFQFYQNLLDNPPVYTGAVLAPRGAGQLRAIDNAYGMTGGGVAPWQQGALGTLSAAELGQLFQPPSAIRSATTPSAISPSGLPSALGAPGVPGALGMPGLSAPVGAPSLPGRTGAPGLPSALGGPALPILPQRPSLLGLAEAPTMMGEIGAPSLPGMVGAPSYNVEAPTIQMPADPQEAVRSLARPLMRQFTEEALP